MNQVQEITSNDFAQQVAQQKGTVLVDFYAQWCGPCKMIAPLLEDINAEFEDVKVVKVDADEAQDIMRQYGIRSIPTLLLFEDGKVTNSSVGAVSLPKLREFVSSTAH